MNKNSLFLGAVLLLFIGSIAWGAETVALFLTGANQGWIKGDSTQHSLGRENTIECLAYSHMLYGEPDPDSGITGEVRDHFPVTILKQCDKATVHLFLAWRNHEKLEAAFWFFRLNPSGDGTMERFYRVVLHDAYIAGIRQEVPNTLDAQTASLPPVERISFTYGSIEVIWEDGGLTANDVWHANTSKIPLSDINFDGIVNMADFAILADEWMTQY